MLERFLLKTKLVINRINPTKISREIFGFGGKGFGKTPVTTKVPMLFWKILGCLFLKGFWFPLVWIPSYKSFVVKILELQGEMVGKGVN